ncbi:MAG TPA: hypothetical protein PK280_20725, partial [Planctomycetota bacterium]|nr:hypothetical protein [Planctomycetota bacterium]
EEKKTETVKGTLSVTKSEDGKKTTYALKVGDVVYTLVGKKDVVKDLAALDKKEVEVTGVVKEKDGKKILMVESFKEAPAAPKTDAPKTDAPKSDAPKTETK